MYAHGTITILNKEHDVIHKFNAKTWIECEVEAPNEAMEKAVDLWLELFKDFGTYVDVDDMWA